MADNQLENMTPLSDLLDTLRQELDKAAKQGSDSDTKFRFNEVEMELQVVTTKDVKVGAGVQFWVYNANAKLNAAEVSTQRLTLKFTPVSAATGAAVKVSGAATK